MDLDELYRILRSAHVRAEGVVDTIRDPLLVLDADLTVVAANPAFYRTFEASRDDTIGVAFHALGHGQWDIEDLRLLLEQVIPKSAAVYDYEVTADFPGVGHRRMLVSAQRVVQSGSWQRVLLLTIVDATERRNKEEAQDFLIGELHHRIKNLLSVTRALARQTNVKDRTAEEYRDAFLGRFDALGKVLEITVTKHTAELPALARAVLAPYVGKNGPVVLEKGPTVDLSAGQSMGLGMILHELATNAVKYGALSVPGGRVSIVWKVDEEDDGRPHVHLRWRETNGPKVAPSPTGGYGTRLIEFAARHDLDGRMEQNFEPDGLVATLAFPQA